MNKWFLLLVIFFYGCATHFTVPSEEALKHPFPPVNNQVKTTLYSPEFTSARLDREGLAILGILKGGPEGLRQNAAFELFQGLRAFFPATRIIPRKDVINRARNNEREHALDQLLIAYDERRVIDSEALKHWQKAEGVRYFLVAQVPYNDRHTRGDMMQLGEDGVAGKVYSFSSGPSPILHTVEKKISLTAEVWDAKCGTIVWKGEGHAEIAEPVKLERVRVEDLFTMLTRDVLFEMNTTISKQNKTTGATPVSTNEC